MQKYLFVVCILLVGMCKGFNDKSIFDNTEFSPLKTWRLKYDRFESGEPMPYIKKEHWYYLGIYKPAYKEKFIFSSTALVAFTDVWHFVEFLGFVFMSLCFLFFYDFMNATNNRFRFLWQWLIFIFIFVWAFRSIGFHITYTIL